MTVVIDNDTSREPDAAVQCDVAIDLDSMVLEAPLIVVEVVSPSSERDDTGDKLVEYFSVAEHPPLSDRQSLQEAWWSTMRAMTGYDRDANCHRRGHRLDTAGHGGGGSRLACRRRWQSSAPINRRRRATMTARPKLAPEQQMTIEEFLAFTDTRPEEERWELIEGVAVLNPSPIDYHQIVVTNIVRIPDCAFQSRAESHPGSPLVGLAHAFRFRAQPAAARRVGEGASTYGFPGHRTMLWFSSRCSPRATPRLDQAWRRRVYASVPQLPALRDGIAQGRRGRRLRSIDRLAGARTDATRTGPRAAGARGRDPSGRHLSMDAAWRRGRA